MDFIPPIILPLQSTVLNSSNVPTIQNSNGLIMLIIIATITMISLSDCIWAKNTNLEPIFFLPHTFHFHTFFLPTPFYTKCLNLSLGFTQIYTLPFTFYILDSPITLYFTIVMASQWLANSLLILATMSSLKHMKSILIITRWSYPSLSPLK